MIMFHVDLYLLYLEILNIYVNKCDLNLEATAQ